MIFRFTTLHAALSSAVAAAATTVTKPLSEDANDGAIVVDTASDPFVPHKLESIENHSATVGEVGIGAKLLEASFSSEVDEAMTTKVLVNTSPEYDVQEASADAIFDAPSELGVLNGAINRFLEDDECGNDRPLIQKSGNDFARVVEACVPPQECQRFYDFRCTEPVCEGCSDKPVCPYTQRNLACWNTSEVTDMSYAFKNIIEFDSSVISWDTSSVTTMRGMFAGSSYFFPNFNQDLSSWNVSAVTDMAKMFDLTDFNQNITSWDVSNVSDMKRMFANTGFNQNIDSWDVSKVTDFSDMFILAFNFNQCLSTWAEKTADDVSTSGMLRQFFSNGFGNACPYGACLSGCSTKYFPPGAGATPDPAVGPWCQGPLQGCFPPSGCLDAKAIFEDSEGNDTSCEQVSALKRKDRRKKCRKDSKIADKCRIVCSEENDCKCSNNPFPFSIRNNKTTTCGELAEKNEKKIEKRCKQKKYKENCPSICNEECSSI